MLFQYVNGDGEPQPVTSGDVNDYIREATGGEFTAKHFRTWGASVIAFEQLLEKPRTRGSASRRWSSRSPRRSATRRRSAANPMSTRRCSRRSRTTPRDPLDGHGAAARAQAAVARRGRACSQFLAQGGASAAQADGRNGLIASPPAAMRPPMRSAAMRDGDQQRPRGRRRLIDWFDANRDELLIGLAVAAGIVARHARACAGSASRLVASDPRCTALARRHRPRPRNGPRSCSWSSPRSTSSPPMPRCRRGSSAWSTSSSSSPSRSRARSGRAS